MLVARALSPRLRRVELAPPGQPQPAALAEARAGGFTYLILPSVLRWEDHTTAWLGGSDRARLLMKVIDIASGDVADIAVVEGRGAELPPAADVAETPAAGLEMPLRAYVDRLLPIPAAAAQK